MRTTLLACCLLLTGCAGLSDRAEDAIGKLDVHVGDVTKALADAPRLTMLIDMADIDGNDRIDSADEWFALLSGVVAAIQSR